MALKPDQRILDWATEYYMTAVADVGSFVVHSVNTGPTPSGAGMDQGNSLASVVTAPSGHTVLGCLHSQVVNKDLTDGQSLNTNRDEVNINQKVSISTKGWVVTDKIQPGITPSGGQAAYLGGTGLVTNTTTFDGVNPRNPVIGKFLTGKDENGFAKVAYNLP